ncbi:hypothetical protein ABIB40_002229 [Pedobacter sp. UYP30]|uniref:putative signal transducing protein n=1 Tax=Pedobacter sp. UYP30 TaxID=1756400 RepID=UPI003394764C
MSDRTTVYRNYYDPMEANIVKGRIADAGFECFLADQNLAILNPLYTQAIGGVRLIVFEKDVSAIDQLLSEEPGLAADDVGEIEAEEKATNDGGKTTCEKCGSDHVGYGMATKKRFGVWAMLVAFATFTYPIFGKKCYHCYDCGHEFSK